MRPSPFDIFPHPLHILPRPLDGGGLGWGWATYEMSARWQPPSLTLPPARGEGILFLVERRFEERSAHSLFGARVSSRQLDVRRRGALVDHDPVMGDLGGLAQHDRGRAVLLRRELDGALDLGFGEAAAGDDIVQMDLGE